MNQAQEKHKMRIKIKKMEWERKIVKMIENKQNQLKTVGKRLEIVNACKQLNIQTKCGLMAQNGGRNRLENREQSQESYVENELGT